MTYTRANFQSIEIEYPGFAKAKPVTVPQGDTYVVPEGKVLYVTEIIVYGTLIVDVDAALKAV